MQNEKDKVVDKLISNKFNFRGKIISNDQINDQLTKNIQKVTEGNEKNCFWWSIKNEAMSSEYKNGSGSLITLHPLTQ